jgi:hypothetical protein
MNEILPFERSNKLAFVSDFCIIQLFFLFFSTAVSAQLNPPENNPFPIQLYPRIAGYVGINHPIVTFSNEGTHTNFNEGYSVGIPTGINIWQSSKLGFSMEVTPFIRVENGISRMNNLLFHQGALFPLGQGYKFIGRLAFETSGRYGLTPILNKVRVIKKNKHSNYFIAVPQPLRFGNEKETSLTAAFQFGIGL